MQIRGKVLSISGSVAEVCIIRDSIACGDCSACLKKLGLHDIIKVATVKKLQVNQEVVLKDNKNWFIKNRIIFIVIGFVLGVIITEALSAIIFFGVNRGGIDLLGGGVSTIIVAVILWIKRPRYYYKIERIEEKV